MFPIINNINDVIPAIKDKPEFIIAEREFGFVINYLVQSPSTFTHEFPHLQNITRECRGILFDKNGAILSRRLHKFFNINERDETQLSVIDQTLPYLVLEKLDGSMVTPIKFPDGSIRWGTKMGITDVSLQAERFVQNKPNYYNAAQEAEMCGMTLIFEWCSRSQQIVVDYPSESLTLIAIRENNTGEYHLYNEMVSFAKSHGIPLVQHNGKIAIENLIDSNKYTEQIEGYVVRFNNGYMLKLKTDWYLRLHRAKEAIQFEKNVVNMIVSETLDDIKQNMLPADLYTLEQFENNFVRGLLATEQKIYDVYNKWKSRSKKEFAIEYNEDPIFRSLVFAIWDEKFPKETLNEKLKQFVIRNTSSQSKIDAIRYLWGGSQYSYNGAADV